MSGPMQTAIKSIPWQDPSKFRLQFVGPGASHAGLSSIDPATLAMACDALNLAEVVSSPIDQWIGEEWRFAIGRLENYQASITFKDWDNYTLYKKISKAIQDFSRMYPNDQKFDLIIQTANDFNITSFKTAVRLKDCIMVSVQGPTLSNSAVASIATFTLNFKCSYVEIG